MKRGTLLVALILISTVLKAQINPNIGDTLYYENNKFSYYKTDTFVVLKERNVSDNLNHFLVEKYKFDTILKKTYLESKFTTNGLNELRSHGIYTEFYKEGQKYLEGKTIEGQRNPDDLWTYYYKNGQKRSQEILYGNSILNLKKIDYPLVINFWDENGVQKVTNGNGIYEFKNEDGSLLKGTLKDGFRQGEWIATKNNKVLYKETYKKGKFVRGESFDENGKKYTYKETTVPATYKKSGISTVRDYVVENFNENLNGESGNLVIGFDVSEEGEISNFKIIKPLTRAYNTEVERIIRTMKKGWKPAIIRGKPVSSTYKLSVNFK